MNQKVVKLIVVILVSARTVCASACQDTVVSRVQKHACARVTTEVARRDQIFVNVTRATRVHTATQDNVRLVKMEKSAPIRVCATSQATACVVQDRKSVV